MYESNNQKERERAEEALLERIGASAAAVEAARAAVSTHSGAGARLDVHLVGSHPTCLQSQLGILSQATSQSVCMFAATCVKGCVEHFYQQMPAGTASTLQAQLWNMVIKDAGSPSPRLPRNIRNSVLYTVCRLAALAWVDDVSVRQVASLCLDRLADAHGGSRSIVAMQAALGSPSSAPPSQASSIPFDIASRVIRELVRTMAVSAVAEGTTSVTATTLRAWREFLHKVVAHAFSVARVTAASTSEHLLTHNLDSVEDSIWESVQDCIEFAGKCLEEVRAVRLLLVQKAGRRGADSSLDYDYQPNIPTTAQLQCLTQPAGVSAFATLAVTLVQHSQGSQGVDPEDSSVRVAVACMQCLGHLGLLKIASMTPTLSDWITALMEAVQVTMSLTAQSLVQQYRSGMGQLQQVATAAMNGNSPTLVTTNRWLNAVCTLFWSTTARLSVPRLASKGVLTKERMGALHVASLVLLQHWYAVPAGALEFLLKGWGELARGAKQVEDTSPSLYQSMGLHQHVVDVVACIVAYHVQLGAVASLDSCGGWELMDQAACAGALRATLYAVPVPVLRVGSAEAIDVLTCAQAQVRSGDW
ncbi:unnamed protein product, partial [Symbiodinium sp. KB8]